MINIFMQSYYDAMKILVKTPDTCFMSRRTYKHLSDSIKDNLVASCLVNKNKKRSINGCKVVFAELPINKFAFACIDKFKVELRY